MTKPLTSRPTLYETDFHRWTQEQAEFLRHQQWDQIDRVHLIEEIESLGKQQRQELRNRLAILIAHLLKWDYQHQCRSRSWLATIRIQRRDTLRLLDENPSLKSYLDQAQKDAYVNARDLAMGDTNLPEQTFPLMCPYTLADILDNYFFPGEPSSWTDQ